MSMIKKIAILTGVIAALCVVFFFVPFCKTSKSYTCPVCGAIRNKKVVRVFGIPIWMRRSKVQRQPVTDIYDKYIGQPHEHEWAGGGYSRTVGTLLGPGLHGDGAHTVKPYSPVQPWLTHIALTAVAQVKEWPKEERVDLYYAILDCNDHESFPVVREIFEQAYQGNSENLWKNWLEKRKEVEQESQLQD